MSDDNGWPDPARPGVPLNPERDGWHWVQRVDRGFVQSPRIILWTNDWSSGQFSWDAIGYSSAPEQKLGRDFRYLGLCLTPADVDARVKEARRDALEEAARVAENEPEPEGDPPPELHGRSVKNIAIASVRATKRSIAAAIRALKGEGHD
jgi:hypothetical protein